MEEIAFFYGVFQSELEHVEKLMVMDGDPARPFDYKYQAREILEGLKKTPLLAAANSQKSIAALGIIEYLLGGNHFETEEITQSEIHYRRGMDWLLKLAPDGYAPYLNTIQDLLNSLGIITSNRGETEQGLEVFKKAEQLHQELLTTDEMSATFTTNFGDFLMDRDQEFRFIIEGGVNRRKAEQSYTLTMFYLAQSYSKLGQKTTSARYCGETMKRQLVSGDYLFKDWAINTLNLAEYFVDNQYFCQAYYTLQCGFKVVPEQGKRKLKATLHMQTGRCLEAMFGYASLVFSKEAELTANVAEKVLLFETLDVPWPELSLPTGLPEAKEFFKQAFAHLKTALEFFVIDGYVTEHIELKRDMSSLYKHLCVFENSEAKVAAMLDRRLELLENFTKEINKQAYARLWQQLMNEVAMIYIEIYETKFTKLEAKIQKGKATANMYNEVNLSALNSIERQTELLNFVEKFEKNEDSVKDIFQSVLNLMFGIARTYSKLEHCEVKAKVSFMEKSLRWYERIFAYLKEIKGGPWSKYVPDMDEHMRISQEMVALLPLRISQVNYGEG